MNFSKSAPSRVFLFLLAHKGECCAYKAIVQGVWGNNPKATAFNMIVGIVGKLRNMGVPIVTVRGKGFMLSEKFKDADKEKLSLLAQKEESVEAETRRQNVVEHIYRNPGVKLAEMAETFGISVNIVYNDIQKSTKLGTKILNGGAGRGKGGYSLALYGSISSIV